jgi:hypothetical protein
MRLVVLVGAGASYGAFDYAKARPPLGDDLFDELVAAFPGTWGNLPRVLPTSSVPRALDLRTGWPRYGQTDTLRPH